MAKATGDLAAESRHGNGQHGDGGGQGRGRWRVALGFTYRLAPDGEWLVNKIKGGWARESGGVKVRVSWRWGEAHALCRMCRLLVAPLQQAASCTHASDKFRSPCDFPAP